MNGHIYITSRRLRATRPSPPRLQPNTTYMVHDVYTGPGIQRGTLVRTTDETGFFRRTDGSTDVMLTNWFATHPTLEVK